MSKLEILKVGPVTAKNGTLYNFTESDLRHMTGVYNPILYRAPLVIGHPSEQAPAYGYVKALSYSNGKLFAEPAQVDPQFSEMVNSGKYLSLSASFYAPHAPGNPKPGTTYLRHVGFLGAWPPAVKGLAVPEFGEDYNNIIEFAGDSTKRLMGTIPWNITRYV